MHRDGAQGYGASTGIRIFKHGKEVGKVDGGSSSAIESLMAKHVLSK